MALDALSTAAAPTDTLGSWLDDALADLVAAEPDLAALAAAEIHRQRDELNLVAASSPTLPRALVMQALAFSAVTAEGYRGRRYHPGARVVDEVETAAKRRAELVFASPHANVQPLSGSAANLAVLHGLLDPGDRVLAMSLAHGGHLSHVSRAASSSKRIPAAYYGIEGDGRVDREALTAQAKVVRPRLIVCGGSALPRRLDLGVFASVAAEVGALLLADISHISGLVAAGVHPSPVPVCDLITTSTYKQLCGPRGGLVLLGARTPVTGRDVDRAVFPGLQGTPDFGTIAAKAVALGFAATPAFALAMRRVVRLARRFAAAFTDAGVPLIGGGTDTHMVLVDLRSSAVSGREVADVFERMGVLFNKNLVPGDPRSAEETSGIRLGTNDLAFRRASDDDMGALAVAVAEAVAALAARGVLVAPEVLPRVKAIAGDILALGHRDLTTRS
jgi:glycine hydroxymethyltransferase